MQYFLVMFPARMSLLVLKKQYVKNQIQHTLHKNDLLCHLNWGAHVLMEISSNV